MGSHATLIGAVALAAALVGLLCGFLLGRSKARAQVEEALDKARASFDAREFDLMEQLSNKMVEISELRARAEGLAPLQEQLEKLKSQQMRSSAGRGPAELGNTTQSTSTLSEQKANATPVVESTDKTIQNYLKSIEEKLKQPPEESQVVAQKIPPPLPAPPPPAPPPPAKLPPAAPPVAAQKSAPPPAPPAKRPAEQPRATTPPIPKPPPAKSPAAAPPPAAKDEWQEFAASLAALTRQKK
jgi:hypothetical protein